MRVVADSHAIYWYLGDPQRLSDKALTMLGGAEDSDGIAISAITLPELWMSSTRKRSSNAASRSGYEILRAAVLDSDTAVDVEQITPEVLRHFESVSYAGSIPATASSSFDPITQVREHFWLTATTKAVDELAKLSSGGMGL